MKHILSFFVILSLACAFLTSQSLAAKPISYLTETVTARYFPNGTLAGNITRQGTIEVEVPSRSDVLQYLRITLSGTSGTNLVSDECYRNVAASPNAGDRTLVLVETTNSSTDTSYEITDPNAAPIIGMKLDYLNEEGGRDLFSTGTNTLYFNLALNTTASVSGVTLVLHVARNTQGNRDAMSLYDAAATSGSVSVSDSDNDGDFDVLTWIGDIAAGSDVIISFRADTTPGTNFNENLLTVDMGGTETARAYHTGPSTLTGIEISDLRSRGPIRQGIEMVRWATWYVRGFIKNIAQDLEYIVNSWALYQVGNPTPVNSSAVVTALNPGDSYYTEWYDTTLSGDNKPYYSAAFDWWVQWQDPVYSGTTESLLYLPVFYEIDSWVDKSVVLNSADSSGTSVTVTDTVRHTGHASLGVSEISIHSVIPHQSLGGTQNAWSISNIRVYYVNNSGDYDITSLVSITSKNSDMSDGYVDVNISNASAVIGDSLRQNNGIRLVYDMSSGAQTENENYAFHMESTLYTDSGTPVTKNVTEYLVVPGTSPTHPPTPTPGGGGGGVVTPVSPLYAAIVKERADFYFVAANLINITVSDYIIDGGDKGIKDIKLLLYIPEEGNLEEKSLYLKIFHSTESRWQSLENGKDFIIRNNGETLVNGKRFTEYLIEKPRSGGIYEDSWNLFNGDKIEINYIMETPIGTSLIITRASGYNYYEDAYIFEDAYIYVRREIKLLDMQVSESEWKQEEAVVGKPVKWIKTFNIHNPNNASLEKVFNVIIPPDSFGVQIKEAGKNYESLDIKRDNNTYTVWNSRFSPQESKYFILNVFTPPVMETKREVNVIEAGEKSVKFLINISVKNFAAETYLNVSLLFRTGGEHIIYVRDNNGELDYRKYDDDHIQIFLGSMFPSEERNITILYEEVPPVLLTSINSLEHTCADTVNSTVFVIPSQKETGAYLEVEVSGPKPKTETVFAILKEMGKIDKLREIRVPIVIDVSNLPDGTYTISSFFKKDFGIIMSDQTEFIVHCPGRKAIIEINYLGFVIIAVVIVALLVIRVYRKKGYYDIIAELKKRARRSQQM